MERAGMERGTDGGGFLTSLDARMDARVDRDERTAAADLARALAAGRLLPEAVGARRPLVWIGESGAWLPIATVGPDHVTTAGLRPRMIRSATALLRPVPGGRPPRRVERDATSVLRGWARSGALVELRAGARDYGGRLVSVGADHLHVVHDAGELFVGAAAWDWISLVRGGSADAL